MSEPEQAAETADGTAATPEVESLRARAEAAERERDQYLALVRSTRAELENDLKRARKSFDEERKFSHSDLAEGLLAILDNLERATAAARTAGETSPLVQGVVMVETQFRDLLKRHGVTPIDARGQPFDPNKHQALMQQPSAEAAPFTVLGVLQQGYMIHDRVLRPANVVVAVAPPDEKKES